MRTALVVTSLLGLGVALMAVRARLQQTQYVGAYALVNRSVEENAAAGRALGLTPVAIGAQRGLLRTPSAGHDWLVYWGGNADTYFQAAVEVVAALGLPPEVGVLIVAPPGFDSPGRPSPEGIRAGAIAVVDWLRATHGAERIVLGSFSLGCFSVYAAATRQVTGAVLVGASEQIAANEPSRWIRLLPPDEYRRAAAGPRVASLVINGEHDWPSDARIVSAWLGSDLLIVPGVDHETSRLHPQVLDAMRAFVRARLAAAVSPEQ